MSYIGNKSQVALYDSFTKEQAEDTFSPITRSRKNLLINGGFDIWQRGPSLAYTSGKPYLADRWKVDSRSGAITVSRQPFPLGQIDVPSNPKYFMRVDHTAASNDGFVNAEQAIEGVHTLAGKTAVLVFYAKADRAFQGKLDMYQNFGTGGTPSAQNDLIDVTTFNFTTSWQKFTTVVNVPSISGKVLGTDGNDALRFLIFSKATTAFTLDIAQVQLEEGDTATDFEYRHIGEELALCQRYYLAADVLYRHATFNVNEYWQEWYRFPVDMRGIPTFSHVVTTSSGLAYDGVNDAAHRSGFKIDLRASAVTNTSFWYAVLRFDAEI